MSKITTGYQLARAAYAAATEYKTLYVRACFGAPMTDENKSRYLANEFNAKPGRREAIEAADADTYGFDCSGLVKGLLWEWCGDKNAAFGGAAYQANGVPDISADMLISACRDASTDFSSIEIGEVVWKSGHIGIYVGGGLSVECTYRWEDGVQITACNTSRPGRNSRVWTKHGRLPYISYTGATEDVASAVFHAFDSEPAPQQAHVFALTMPRQRGELVTALQSLLNYSGYTDDDDKPVKIDGTLGPRTWQALRKFLAIHAPAPVTNRVQIFCNGVLRSEFDVPEE